MSKTRFRVRVDLGEDGVVDLEVNGNIKTALGAGYEECKKRKTNPVSITTTQIIDLGKWQAITPIRPA
ncbi:MAG: hypothetical protein CMA72_04570 [Euryarchaeota archaeon]|nr:hypothetical protein [Euryarchaeota archaeon]|tara:strand:- start:1817 stop:2020 length:204 start_codon:yes stop_codon:yes gene_type:complete